MDNGIVKEQPRDHYFYFPQREDADRAAKKLHERGWAIQPVTLGTDNKNWLVLAGQPGHPDDIAKLHDELDHFAAQFHGQYDGWEVAAPPAPTIEKK